MTRKLLNCALAVGLLGGLLMMGSHDAEAGDNKRDLVMAACDDVAINAAVTCGDDATYNGLYVGGYNWATFEILYTKSATGTGYTFYLETCWEGASDPNNTKFCSDATDWHRVTTQLVVSGTGVTLTADPIIHVAAATDRITWSIPLNYRRIRLGAFTGSGTPTTDDKITVRLRLSNLPGM